MANNARCARDGCDRYARGDEYCSAECCRVDHIAGETPFDRKAEANRRRRVAALRTKVGDSITVTNPDMMAHVLPGSAGKGRRGADYKRPASGNPR